jgi:hypothetical protein
MAILQKITVGFVIQEYDTEKEEFISQEFIAGDDVTYVDEAGEECISITYTNMAYTYLPFDMVQPEDMV